MPYKNAVLDTGNTSALLYFCDFRLVLLNIHSVGVIVLVVEGMLYWVFYEIRIQFFRSFQTFKGKKSPGGSHLVDTVGIQVN